MKKRCLTVCALFLALVLGILSPAAVLAESVPASVSVAGYTLKPEPCALTLNFNGDAYSRSFSWLTDGTVEETLLYLTESDLGEGADFTAAELYTGRRYCETYIETAMVSHQVEVMELKPGATYSYKAGGHAKKDMEGEGYFTFGTFTVTPADGDLVILHMSDAQTREAELLGLWENTVRTAVGVAGGAENVNFLAFGGDLYDKNLKINDERPEFELSWCAALDTVRGTLAGIPWIATSGNHDVAWEPFYAMIYNAPFAGKTDYSRYYSFDCGNVHFIQLDSNQGVNNKRADKMYAWCEADLAAALANPATDWIMVMLHNGPYTTGDHGDDDATHELTEVYAPLFSKYHVDLVLQGHDHVFTKTLPYRWDAVGYTTSFDDASVVNFEVPTVTIDGVCYDNNPAGTYYICPGAAGHRVGEDESVDYATAETGMYLDNQYKTEVGTVLVNSDFYTAGGDSTGAPAVQMFGMLRVSGERLVYDYYTVDESGSAALLDTIAVYKGTDAQQSADDRAADALIASLEDLPYAETAEAADLPAILSAVKQYASLSAAARDSLYDLYENRIASYLALDSVSAAMTADFEAALTASCLADAEFAAGENGTATLRLVAARRDATAVVCGMTVSAGGKTAERDATELYTGRVTANGALGLTHEIPAAGAPLYALTLTDAPAAGVYTVSLYERAPGGSRAECGSFTFAAVGGQLIAIN